MQDLRDAIRALRASSLVSAVAILSLALGIGATTAIFSILNSLVLKPLPVHEPERLVALATDAAGEDEVTSYRVWREVRARQLLDRAFVWASDRTFTAEGSETIPLETIWASGAFFETLGVPAFVGRTFNERDDRPGGGPDGPVAVLDRGFAQRRYGSAEAAVGKLLIVERVPFTVIGVTPPDFFGLDVGRSFDVALPLETERLLQRRPSRLESVYWPWLHITARLGAEGTPAAATAAMRAAQQQIRAATMPDYGSRDDLREAYLRQRWRMRAAATGSSGLRSRYLPALAALLAIVAVVLMIACANIANLQLARAAARRHQFALRAALGASRLRIARGVLVESLLLSAAGAGLGLAFAQWASRLIVSQLSTWASTAFLDLSPDWRVLATTGTVMVATAVLFGTVPALRGARVDPIEALKQGDRGLAPGGTLSGGLVIAQISLSLLLVVGAAWFLRSFATLAYRDLGFDRGRVVVAIVDARRTAAAPGRRGVLYEQVKDAVAAVPGVESAATSMATPLGSAGVRFTPEIEVADDPAFRGRSDRVLTTPVSPDWFRTFGTPLLAGRDFEARDHASAPHVAIVNEAFARRYFDGSVPVGRTLVVRPHAGGEARTLEIVGLVRDAAFASVRTPVEPTLYRPLTQGVEERQLASAPTISVSVRAMNGLPPGRLAKSVSSAIAGVDENLSVSFQTVSDHLRPHYIRERLLALLAGFFGALGLLLAAVGLYGVTAYSVGRRRAEIGIRIALGADRRRVVRLVLRRVALLTSIGIAAGVVASLWAARFVQALLFNTSASDPRVLAGCAVLLALVGGAAGWIPARRAARLDPAVILREG